MRRTFVLMLPLHVESATPNPATVVRETAGGFRVIETGNLGELITGYRFVIVGARLADFLLTHCSADLELSATFVFRPSTSERWPFYFEVAFHRHLLPENLPLPREDTGTAWGFLSSHLFIRPELGASLDISALGLSLSEGFSEFGGFDA